MKVLLTGIITLLLPSFCKPFLLRLLGHQVDTHCKIGFSLLLVSNLCLKKHSWIGHFNIILLDTLSLDNNAFIKKYNKIMAKSLIVAIENNGSIGSRNSISRMSFPISYGLAALKIGVWGQIVHGCTLDCSRSITIGNYSTLGGTDTQLWTHGYYHGNEGIERIRIDGEIRIGNNVYVGSRCTFNPGVAIADGIHIGGHCCISKSLDKQGMYVAQPLRYIENNIDSVKTKLYKVDLDGLVDDVYEKRI